MSYSALYHISAIAMFSGAGRKEVAFRFPLYSSTIKSFHLITMQVEHSYFIVLRTYLWWLVWPFKNWICKEFPYFSLRQRSEGHGCLVSFCTPDKNFWGVSSISLQRPCYQIWFRVRISLPIVVVNLSLATTKYISFNTSLICYFILLTYYIVYIISLCTSRGK